MDAKAKFKLLLKENKGTVIVLTLLSSIAVVFGVAFAYASKLVIEKLGDDQFYLFAIMLGLIAIFEVIIKLINRMYKGRKLVSLENDLRKKTFLSYLDSSYLDLDKNKAGDNLNRILNDASTVSGGVLTLIPEGVAIILRIVLSVALLFVIDWVYGVAILIFGTVMFLINIILRRPVKRLYKSVQKDRGEIVSLYKNGLTNSFLWKLFASEETFGNKADEVGTSYASSRIKHQDYAAITALVMSLVLKIAFAFAIVFAAYKIGSGSSIGSFVLLVEVVLTLESPLSNVGEIAPAYYHALGSLERIQEISSNIHQNQHKEPEFAGIISVKGASFGYSSKMIINNVNAEISPKDFVLIKGPSGSGKSTFLKCLAGAYPLNEGSITINGEAISNHQGLFAYVPQGNYLLPMSIRDNLTIFADKNIGDEDIKVALEKVSLLDKINSLENGLDTTLKDNGAGLSEGEGQRLSIARALLSNRPILLLDECTSALDEDTEKSVLNSLKALDKTIVLISHKKEGETHADKVLTINGNA